MTTKRMHSQPDPIHTPTPALAGIVSSGRRGVRPGNPSSRGVGRILATATTVAVIGGAALVGGAAARPNRLSATSSTGVTAVGRVRELATERPSLHALSVEWRDALCAAGFAVPTGDSPIIPLILGEIGRAHV